MSAPQSADPVVNEWATYLRALADTQEKRQIATNLRQAADEIERLQHAAHEPAKPRYLRPWTGTALMYARAHHLAVSDDWCRGFNACLDALDAKGCEVERPTDDEGAKP